MFNYINTFLVNDLTDKLSGKQKFEFSEGKLKVLRAVSLTVSGITKGYKTEAKDPVLGDASFTLVAGTGAGKITAGDICRINVYVRQNGNNDSRYANSMLLKGRPFLFEFKAVGTTAAEIATNAVKTIKKTMALFGNPMIGVTSEGAKLIIKCLDEYQLITDAVVEKLVEDKTSIMAVEPYNRAKFVPWVEGVIVKSAEGVGTYTTILKNLRLPTYENIRWTSPSEPEMPILGSKYTQYTFEFVQKRGVMGGDAMGEASTSITTHIFYIKEDLVNAFEAVLTSAGIAFANGVFTPVDPVEELKARVAVLEAKP